MSWKEYELNNNSIADWLPWGALTHENVMRNKDDSVLGIISYQKGSEADVSFPKLPNGWALWIEEQQVKFGEEECYLAVSWNPFLVHGKVVNTVDGKVIYLEELEMALHAVLLNIAESFPKENHAHLLAYQEMIDYLCHALTLGKKWMPMPDVPVDLDAYLTDELCVDFSGNHVKLGKDTFLVLSLPACVGSSEEVFCRCRKELKEAKIPYRHVQRLLLYREKSAKRELLRYTKKWCNSRKYIKSTLLQAALGELNGLYQNMFILLVSEQELKKTEHFLRQLCEELEIPYIIEDYNAKDLWWGSLPSLFRAAIYPPICGFANIGELLARKEDSVVSS